MTPTGTGTPRPAFEHRPPKHGLIGPFGARQIAAGLVIVVAVVVLLLAITAPLGHTGVTGPRDPHPTPYVLSSAPATGLQRGQLAPELATTRPDGTQFTLTDIQGNPVRLADLRGKAVWINFFASWCPPCQAETPVLRDTYAAYKDKGVAMIGISVSGRAVPTAASTEPTAPSASSSLRPNHSMPLVNSSAPSRMMNSAMMRMTMSMP